MTPFIVLFDRHICVMIIKVASYGGAICQYWDWKGAVMINRWPTVLLYCTAVMWYTTGLWCDVMDYWVKINWFKIPAASWICWYGDDRDDEDDDVNYYDDDDDDDEERLRRWWWCLLQNFDAALDSDLTLFCCRKFASFDLEKFAGLPDHKTSQILQTFYQRCISEVHCELGILKLDFS